VKYVAPKKADKGYKRTCREPKTPPRPWPKAMKPDFMGFDLAMPEAA